MRIYNIDIFHKIWTSYIFSMKGVPEAQMSLSEEPPNPIFIFFGSRGVGLVGEGASNSNKAHMQ